MSQYKAVACPWCKAPAGKGCVNSDGSPFKTGIHMARYYEAQKVKRVAS